MIGPGDADTQEQKLISMPTTRSGLGWAIKEHLPYERLKGGEVIRGENTAQGVWKGTAISSNR